MSILRLLLFFTVFAFLPCRAQSWHFVSGPDVDRCWKKNLGAQPEQHFRPSAHDDGSGGAAVLPQGDTAAALRTFTNLAPGYYDVQATISAPNPDATCYLFGKGNGYTMGSTLVPAGQNVKVRVRGVGTADGVLLAGVYSCGSQKVQVHDLKIEPSSSFNFLQGGDITELNYVLDKGGRYADALGNTLCPEHLSREEMAQNVLNYLSANGMNFVRIRLTNNPGRPDNSNTYYIPEGYQDESDCLQLARMANQAGMEIQFTFNWSDFWSNGSQQDVPADWEDAVKKAGQGKEVETLERCAYDYTKKVMRNLDALGIHPAYVSLGNETNGGFLFPYAYAYDVPSSEATTAMPQGYKNWWAIAKIVNAGYKAVKEVSPESQVVIHLADNTYDVVDKPDHVDWWVYSWYFDELKKAGANFDVIGASYYPSWSTATAGEAAKFYAELIKRYGKDILVMETGYNWTEKRKDGYDGQLPYTAPAYKDRFPFSKGGQKGFIADVLNELKAVNAGGSHRVVGDLYWDPMMIHVEDAEGKNATGWADWWQWKTPDANVVENTTLFDFTGRALPAFDAYRYNRNSLPLRAHSITAEATDGVELELASEACYGDSISIKWNVPEGYKVDSVKVSFGSNCIVYKEDKDAREQKMEMPDADLFCRVFGSKIATASVEAAANGGGVKVTAVRGGVELSAVADCRVAIVAANGIVVREVTVQASTTRTVELSPGVYMVNGRKVIVE